MAVNDLVLVVAVIWVLLDIFRGVSSHTKKYETRKCRACGERVEKSRYREHRRKHYRWGKNDF